MQPSNAGGRRLRLILMPVSWAIALFTVYILFAFMAYASGTDIRSLLQTDSLWPLSAILPCFIFGKILGLMTINLIAFLIPPFRQIFEAEAAQTGRHEFSQAMRGLAKAAAILGIITALGSILFLYNR